MLNAKLSVVMLMYDLVIAYMYLRVASVSKLKNHIIITFFRSKCIKIVIDLHVH